MTTKQIIDEMEKEFDELFIGEKSYPKDKLYPERIRVFIKDYTRKLIEAVAEELMSVKLPRIEDDYSPFTKGIEQGFNAVMAKQRLKVKEIINSLEK